MTITISSLEGYTLAECTDVKTYGLPGIGSYTLCAQLEFAVAKPLSETVLRNLNLRLEWGENTQSMIGVAPPDGGQPISIPNHRSLTIYFRFSLTPNQVEAIEKMRLGQGFNLTLWLSGEVCQGSTSQPYTDHGTYKIKQSDWLSALNKMGYANTLLYEFRLPRDITGTGGSSFKFIENAERYLHQGEYDLCVGECRKVFEHYPLPPADQSQLGTIRGKLSNKSDRESMTVKERWILLRDALYMLTHPPHHSAQSESYSRDQAKMILTSTISYCTSM
ncbi:hypothetical protein BTA51_19250 [Hahella sp. CCB-MM4]|uniref:hypothetical protein n=1 Tax=Hahella sp. (strain CCB-MM4) TaxID=1926491 RepID=UPI000B9B0178|nr:hypothetical protein [Hahella sp. CCB-MM4]OZG71774.1 hypothetical protein BTA51_19250 [Hahella sp. CCB-MM4]